MTLFVAWWPRGVALLVVNVLGVLGALSVVVSEPSRRWRSAPREAHWPGALRSPGLLAPLGAFPFVGVAPGSITVTAVAYADDHGRESVYGWTTRVLNGRGRGGDPVVSSENDRNGAVEPGFSAGHQA